MKRKKKKMLPVCYIKMETTTQNFILYHKKNAFPMGLFLSLSYVSSQTVFFFSCICYALFLFYFLSTICIYFITFFLSVDC